MPTNRLLTAAERMRSAGRAVVDLSDSRFHANGLEYPADRLLEYYSDYLKQRNYQPDARGLESTRVAVSGYMKARAVDCPADQVLLTASTSEGYSLVFQALCTPGERVILPRPVYPLFEQLVSYAGLRSDYYDLDPRRAFAPDLGRLERALRRPAACVVTISPNNPTGAVLSAEEFDSVQRLCRDAGAIHVHDEVFDDLVWNAHDGRPGELARAGGGGAGGAGRVGPDSTSAGPLTIRLGGISKLFASPDLKLAWLAVTGSEEPNRSQALENLELARDTYLNASAPSEFIASRMFLWGDDVRASIRRTLLERRSVVEAALSPVLELTNGAVRLLPQAGGIHRVLELPPEVDDEAEALLLLEEEGIVVHPGYFYRFAGGVFWVFTIMSREAVLRKALRSLTGYLERRFGCYRSEDHSPGR